MGTIVITAILSAIVAIGAYVLVTTYVTKNTIQKQRAAALKEAEAEGEMIKKEKILQAKEKFIQLKSEHDRAVNERNQKVREAENRVRQAEQALQQQQKELERKMAESDKTKAKMEAQIASVEERKAELAQLMSEQNARLEQISGMSSEEAKNTLNPTGLSVYSLTNGGEFTKLSLDECTITGFDSSVAVKEQVITVTYKGFTDTFTIEIKEEPTGTPVLESISMQTLPKTEYKVKEGLNSDGGVILCTYSDGSTKTVDLINEYVYGFRAAYLAGVGTYDITVKYNEDGVTAETTYKITITK